MSGAQSTMDTHIFLIPLAFIRMNINTSNLKFFVAWNLIEGKFLN